MILLLAISIFITYSVQAQERFFFGNRAVITISKSAIISTTITLTPTCYEPTELPGGGFEVCRRKKRQYGFLVDPFEYYHGDHPQHVTFIQPSAMPDFRYSPLLHPIIFNVQLSYEDKTPSLQTSISEKAEAEGRFFLPKLLTRQTVTSVVTIPTVGTATQSLGIDCTVPGQSIPENVCNPSIVFPPVPDGFNLNQYCQSIGEVAQMAIIECRYAAKRKRSRDGRPVVIRFGRRAGGRFPSRRLIAINILTFCVYRQFCSFPIGFVINLALVGVPGFPDIIAAGGESSSYVSG